MARGLASGRFFPSGRRDASRLLSSAGVLCGAGLVRIDHPAGRLVAVLAGVVSLSWWHGYRRLQG